MEKQIGIVIPPEVRAEIVEFGKHHNCNIVEPYITFIPNEVLRGAKAIDRNLQSYCLSQPPFKTIIGGPNIENNDNGQIFFLTIMMGTLNATRDKLMKHLKLKPYTGIFRPQASLLEQPMNGPYDFDAMLAEAKTVFSKPRSISVDALAIYTRTDPHEPYKMHTSYPFTGR